MAAGKLVLIKRKQGIASRALKIAKRNQKTLSRKRDMISALVNDVTSTMSSTPTIVDVTISVSSANTHDGFNVFMKVLRIRGLVRQNLTSALADDYRIDVILDRFPEEALPLPLDIYGSATPSTIRQVIFSERNRFKILKSWRGLLEPENNIGRHISADIKLNLKLETDTDGTFGFGNLTKNMIVMIFWTTASANQPSFLRNFRIEFVD